MEPLPPGLAAQAALGPDWAAWLSGLPRLVGDLVVEWDLVPDGAPMHGYCSLVLPVRGPDGEAAALKVTFDGDEESAHEALALQRWGGRGAVRLLRADPRRRALLLERLDPSGLSQHGDREASEIVAGLYSLLHVPAPPQLRTVTSYVERWLADLRALGADLPIPRRMVHQALHLGDALVADPGSSGVLVHGDLHGANVLARPGAAGPWVAIDPKPMSGDPHYEPAPMLWNRWEEIAADVRAGVRRRFHALVDGGGLDQERARDWVIVRMVVNASWTLRETRDPGRSPSAEDRAWVTRCLAIAKAVQE